MKYIFMLLFSFTLQAQSLLLLFDDEADSTTTIPAYAWQIDPTLQMFTNATPTLGNELVTNGDFSSWSGDNPAGWTVGTEDANNYVTEATGKCRIVSNGSAVGIEQSILTVGNKYVCTITVTTVTSGGIRVAGTAIYKTMSSAGTYTFCFTADNAKIYVLRDVSTGANDVTFDNISVKPLTNFTPPAYANDYSAGGIVEGSDLVTNGNFSDWSEDNPTGWELNDLENGTNYVTESSGKVRLVSDNTKVMGIYQMVTSAGNYYLGKITITNVTAGVISARGFGGLNTTGAKSVVYLSASTGINVLRYGVTDITFDDISYKPLTNGIPGIFQGGMDLVQPGTNTSGIESGFIFDGVNDFIAVACTTSTTNSTLSAWVKFTTTGAERYIFGTTTGYVRKSSSEIIQASSGTIYLDGQPYSGSAISAGWHLVTVTGIALSGTVLNVGASITPGSYMAGFIDRAGRFNGTLSANQVLKLYNDQKARYGL